MSRFSDLFSSVKPIIGVIHLAALPGSAGSPGLASVLDLARRDLDALERGGVDGVLVENDGDTPPRVEADRATIASMTRITRELVASAARTRIGIEILLNDPCASIAVAAAAGASFIRTDYFVDRMTRPEYGGEMAIDPRGLLDYRRAIGASQVLILADVQVKYARMIEPRPLSISASIAAEHDADAIVVTGAVTGEPPAPDEVIEAGRGARDRPVLVGSGLDAANARSLLAGAHGAIVGTSLKSAGRVDEARVRELMAVVHDAFGRR